MHTITSPTGVSVTKELTEDEVRQLQATNYFNVKTSETFEGEDSSLKQAFDGTIEFDLPVIGEEKAAKPRIHISDNGCESCSA
jgi:hypothetical protein